MGILWWILAFIASAAVIRSFFRRRPQQRSAEEVAKGARWHEVMKAFIKDREARTRRAHSLEDPHLGNMERIPPDERTRELAERLEQRITPHQSSGVQPIH